MLSRHFSKNSFNWKFTVVKSKWYISKTVDRHFQSARSMPNSLQWLLFLPSYSFIVVIISFVLFHVQLYFWLFWPKLTLLRYHGSFTTYFLCSSNQYWLKLANLHFPVYIEKRGADRHKKELCFNFYYFLKPKFFNSCLKTHEKNLYSMRFLSLNNGLNSGMHKK